MSFGSDRISESQKKAAAKTLRREPNDPDPEFVAECFSGDVVEIPFLGVCEFGFFLGKRVAVKQGKKKIFVGAATGFVRRLPPARQTPRTVEGVPGWVPVRCIERKS